MSSGPSPIFLERQTYRLRRLRDAARLLPVLGALLLAIPLLWSGQSEGDTVSTSSAITYVFGVWILLILGTVIVALGLRRKGDESKDELR